MSTNIITKGWGKLTLFQKWFVIIFLLGSLFSFCVPLFTGSQFADLFSFLSIVSLIMMVAGVLASIYQARAEVTVYFFLIINTITYAYVAYAYNLYGQIFQNLILLLPIQIYGFFTWHRNVSDIKQEHVAIKRFTFANWILVIFSLIVSWIIYFGFVKAFPQLIYELTGLFMKTGAHIKPDPTPAIDSLVTILTVMAMVFTALRYFDQWYFWISSNIIGILLFLISLIDTTHYTASSIVGDLSGMINWAQYLTGGIYGFYL